MEQPSEKQLLRVLVLEPYYGGSHQSFLQDLGCLPFEFTFLTFPARNWKWRMRLAGPYYARQLQDSRERFDRIICSTFVDVATLRGLAPPWVQEVPLLTYFHENQFVYPVRVEAERDFHFALTNMTTALASDRLAFNSSYNLETFLNGIEAIQKKSDELKLNNACHRIRRKSRILPPGIDFSGIDREERGGTESVPVILWNHRWEHDKNPEAFFGALFELDRAGVDFRLIVLGQSYREIPVVFDQAREKLSHKVLHFGYVPSRKEYVRWLRCADIAVSTARHEFFGISVLEAVRAGCRPLLPKRLAYPEWFPLEFLYEEEDFANRLKDEILHYQPLTDQQTKHLTDRFSWERLGSEYCIWIEGGSRSCSNERTVT
jgi:glycosyltransferase involved in cell wall biosynthesis